MPVYNIEAYIAEAIDSILAQTISFDNIELILVNDGSTDNSANICQGYVDKYSNNITLITQKNAGVSAARNRGFASARGEFVHFFDGDDLLSKDYYKNNISFLESHEEIDFVASKIKFFDEIIDSHPLNYKFYTSRVIDTTKEPESSLMHVITCIFRASSITKVSFDEKLSIAEDVKYISDVLLHTQKYGVTKHPTYYYRKRTSGLSAIGGSRRNRDYYMAVPERSYKHILKSWHIETGDTLPVEHTILYDLSYRLDQSKQSILDTKDEQKYKKNILDIAARCSDEAIATSRFLSIHQKLYLLRHKYNNQLNTHIHVDGTTVYFNSIKLYDLQHLAVHLDFLTYVGGDEYKVEGYSSGYIDIPGVSIMIHVDEAEYNIKLTERVQREKSFVGDVYETGGAFCADITMPVSAKLSFTLRLPNESMSLPIITGPFTRFGALKLTYRRDDHRLLKRRLREITTHPYSISRHIRFELRMLYQILFNWRINTVLQRLRRLRTFNLAQLSAKGKLYEIIKPWFFMAEAIFYIPRAFILRIAYHVAILSKRRPIWLISDRGTAAGDNGEALFRYIMSRGDCPADVYFVISKKSKDFARLSRIGKVIKQESLRYKLKFLLSDKIIASQADVETTNPFIRQGEHYRDLFNFDFVFLQHGIIRHNLSSWLNRYNKNVQLFITSAQKEYDSIFNNPYYYEEKNVLLSGLPRYDYLKNNPKRKIILAPTYRKNLVKQKTDRNGSRRYDTTFKQSTYRNFYNDLINDERLKAALEKADMIGEFYLHPVFSMQRKDFDENSRFKVMAFPYNYKMAFSEGAMLISDHSSVVFDFSYLKKPVAYAYFDVDTFFEGHSYDESNFFSDEDDGFGEVYYDYDTLVEGIVKTIEAGCVMSQKYQQRVDNFFYKVDTKNSERVYTAMLEMEQ